MRKVFIGSLATLAVLALPTSVSAAARDLRDLIGARGSSGEMELQSRGYAVAKGNKAQGGSVTFWGNASNGSCVKVLTRNGRYASIVDAPAASCGMRGNSSSGGRKVNVSDINGMSSANSFDVMTSRGFKGVDTVSGGNDLYAIYYNPSTRQCIQVGTSAGRVVNVTDIQTHPKCR